MAVLESPLLATHGAGVLLPICLCMQERGLTLQKAQWTDKNTNAGFSVSFFWPTSEPCAMAVARDLETVPRKCRRSSRRRRKLSKAIQCELDSVAPSLSDLTVSTKSKCQVKDNASVMGVAKPLPSTLAKPTASEPMEDDSALSEDVSTDGIDLIACSDVRYENHRGVPGLCYQLDGETTWTRVKPKRKRRQKRQDSTIQLQQSQESSDEELDVAEARGVQYKVKGGIPGLEIRRGHTLSSVSWTPVVSKPAAAVHAPIAHSEPEQRLDLLSRLPIILCVVFVIGVL